MKLTRPQTDRAAGVLLATACGDALGAGYEFGPPLPSTTPVGMVGGGRFNWASGEWTDDTSMALAIAEVAAGGADLRSPQALDAIAARWAEWASVATDVGSQTRAVLRAAGLSPTGASLTAAATAHHERTGQSAGNGALMRTAPVALAYLHDRDGLIKAAYAIASLTHHDPEAGEACALWCMAIRHAVLHGTFEGLRAALDTLPADRASVWAARLDEAEGREPASFTRNGWVVEALQAAWSAITRTPVPADDPAANVFAAQHLQNALEAAVRGGRDTDTVAAIAGGLVGARWGVSAVPAEWRRILHGWPDLRARDLVRLGLLSARAGHDDRSGWPSTPVFDYSQYGDVNVLVSHPEQPGLLVGGVNALRNLPDGVDAVVSLCRLGASESPPAGVVDRDHVEVWLLDDADPDSNPHLEFVLHDAQRTVATMLAEGRRVLLHCVQAQSRTPTVLALHLGRTVHASASEALTLTTAALPLAAPNSAFCAALRRLLPAKER